MNQPYVDQWEGVVNVLVGVETWVETLPCRRITLLSRPVTHFHRETQVDFCTSNETLTPVSVLSFLTFSKIGVYIRSFHYEVTSENRSTERCKREQIGYYDT